MHRNSKVKTSYCTAFGSTEVDHTTRITGYLKRIARWSSDHQREEGRRAYHRGPTGRF